jgi:hypothetical protein
MRRHAFAPYSYANKTESRRILPSALRQVHLGGDTGRRSSARPAALDPVPFRNTLSSRRVN